MPLFLTAALLLLQQGANSTPPSADTTGYWQQRVAYTIVATLDEPRTRVHATGELLYVNNSPDTLREMYFHQYLNAFRPDSKWSEVDEREGRERFQHLKDPDYGYERFTSAPLFGGVPVQPQYPGAPDSTVVRFALPRPLAPHDSIRIQFAWDARPSTVPRRQARRGRSWDLAQWYPKVAVYDRGGWEANAFTPSGELYGEFGTYDVTLIVANDQVVVATGVPVSGDPGWARVQRGGTPPALSSPYGDVPPAAGVDVPAGYRAVRFYARDVHHFAWSSSPDYLYEGARYVRELPATHFPTWDTVSINVLYKPGDESTWGNGIAASRIVEAFRWLESIYGPYAWPTFTMVHRIEGGGTEFPMMIMTGSASQGMILHEGGHQYTYGILGNNEWRSGWMDEGLTSYQTSWAEGTTPQERARSGVIPAPPRLPEGYRVNAVTIPPAQRENLGQIFLDLLGYAQPIGTPAYAFHDFGTYNEMVYSRASLMYSHLRDALGDTTFRSFLHDYYERWALKHVDERAMRGSAERESGEDLGWFFDEWVHHTGVLDYALQSVVERPRPDGKWITDAVVVRRGEYRHPMPVGVLTHAGWVFGRGDARDDRQTVEIVTGERPSRVEIDPLHYTWDWDRRDDRLETTLLGIPQPRIVYDWPFLNQADRDHTIFALSPQLWYGNAFGGVVGARARTNYLGLVDRYDLGAGVALRQPWDTAGVQGGTISRFQLWARAENPYLPGFSRPLMGQRFGAALLDGILEFDWSKRWDLSPYPLANGPSLAASVFATGAYPTDHTTLPEQWQFARTTEAGGRATARTPLETDSSYWRGDGTLALGVTSGDVFAAKRAQLYSRLELSGTRVQSLYDAGQKLIVRGYLGLAPQAPVQRQIFLATADPLASFDNNWWRPRGGVLKQEHLNWIPLGGGVLRGYSPYLSVRQLLAGNGELTQRIFHPGSFLRGTSVWASAFGDIGVNLASRRDTYGDAGAGISLRGRVYDRDVVLRLDLPILVKQADLSGGGGLGGRGSLAPRFVFSTSDIW